MADEEGLVHFLPQNHSKTRKRRRESKSYTSQSMEIHSGLVLRRNKPSSEINLDRTHTDSTEAGETRLRGESVEVALNSRESGNFCSGNAKGSMRS